LIVFDLRPRPEFRSEHIAGSDDSETEAAEAEDEALVSKMVKAFGAARARHLTAKRVAACRKAAAETVQVAAIAGELQQQQKQQQLPPRVGHAL
jgi:hypothetical protein